MNKRALALQEHLLARTVINDYEWFCDGDYLIVLSLIVPDPEFRHLYGVFRNLGLVVHLTVQIQIYIAIHGWVDRRHHDALQTVSNLCALMHHAAYTLDDLFTLGMRVQAAVEF